MDGAARGHVCSVRPEGAANGTSDCINGLTAVPSGHFAVRLRASTAPWHAVPSSTVPTLREILNATLAIVGSVVVATMAAVLVDVAGATPPVPPAVAAAVVAVCFWWRAPEGLGAFGVFVLLAATIEHWTGVDLLLFDEIAVLMFAVVAVVRHGAPNGRIRVGAAELGLAALAAAGLTSSLVESVPVVTMLAGLALLLKAVALFYIVSWLRLRSTDVARVGIVVIGLGVLIGFAGFVEWLNPAAFQTALNLPPFAQTRGGISVVRSIFLHPALYGWLTAFTALLLYAIFLTRRSWWALPLALALSLGTLLSGRRTPLVGVVLGLVAGLAWQFRSSATRASLVRTWIPIFVAGVVAIVLLLPTLSTMVTHTLSEYLPDRAAVSELFSDDPDPAVVAVLHPRTALYLGSVAVAIDRLPLGAGFGRYGSHLSRSEYSPIYADYGLDRIAYLQPERADAVTDTYWPMVLGETGLIGLLGALTFIGVLTARLWRATGASSEALVRTISLGVLMIFAEGLVRSLTASVYTAPPIAHFILGAAGLSIALQRTAEEESAD